MLRPAQLESETFALLAQQLYWVARDSRGTSDSSLGANVSPERFTLDPSVSLHEEVQRVQKDAALRWRYVRAWQT